MDGQEKKIQFPVGVLGPKSTRMAGRADFPMNCAIAYEPPIFGVNSGAPFLDRL